jgi:excisionase family DNA binding protein
MNAIKIRCQRQRCGYLIDRCKCPGGPLLPWPSASAGADDQLPDLMTPGEVAALFRVDPKTVTRWAQQGKIRSLRTLGGHRRYAAAEVRAFLDKGQPTP